jgi:hypothetical protein
MRRVIKQRAKYYVPVSIKAEALEIELELIDR